MPPRWARLWKLHGSINWRFNRASKTVFRTEREDSGDELLIHPSHLNMGLDDVAKHKYSVAGTLELAP